MQKQQIPLKNSLLLLLAAIIWGIAFVAQSVGMDYVGGFTFNAVRSLIGAAVLVPLILVFESKKSTDTTTAKIASHSRPTSNTVSYIQKRKDLIIGGISCGICLCLASNFQQFGIKYTSVGKAGFITACYIVIVPIIGLFLGKKCSKFIWAAVGMALIGLYLLCITDGFSIGKGDLLVLVCAFLFSVHILVIDHFSPKVDGVKLSCLQFLTCGILSGIPALLFERPSFSAICQAWMPILYAGIMSCGVAYTLQIIGQKNMNPTVASLILSLESCISVLAGWVLLGQQLSTREILGCVIMFAAIILAQLPQKQNA
jgi:drug/metabolite transporter (DMT)-like permease